MKASLHLPIEIVIDAPSHGETLRTIAQATERLDFDACNLTDHPAPTSAWRNQGETGKTSSGGHDALDPFTGLAFIAAATTRLRLHTHILVLPYRNPFITAKAAATLDMLSDGRLTLGVASGYLKGEYAAVGADFAARGAIMDDALKVWKLAWSGEPVDYEGRGFKGDAIMPRPLPAQKPHPPIWGGGNGAPAVRRAAEQCDGWSPFFAAPEHAAKTSAEALVTIDDLRAKIADVREMRARAGRSGGFDICVAPPTKRVESCTPAEAQRIIDVVGQMAEIGVTWIVASMPQTGLSGFLDSIQWYSEDVLPHVHALQPHALA